MYATGPRIARLNESQRGCRGSSLCQAPSPPAA